MKLVFLLVFLNLIFSNPSNGSILFSPIISMPEEGTIFETYLMDNNYNIINTWESNYCVAHTPYIIDDTILVRPGRIFPPYFDAGGIGGILQMYDWSGNIIWETMWANNQYQQHHDIEILPNGNILLISYPFPYHLQIYQIINYIRLKGLITPYIIALFSMTIH